MSSMSSKVLPPTMTQFLSQAPGGSNVGPVSDELPGPWLSRRAGIAELGGG